MLLSLFSGLLFDLGNDFNSKEGYLRTLTLLPGGGQAPLPGSEGQDERKGPQVVPGEG